MIKCHKTIIRLVSTQAFQGPREFVPVKASRTSNSTHNLFQASKAFVQPGLPRLVTQPTYRFQSVFLAKASRTSNSTQDITGLPERLSNQGFQELITQPKLKETLEPTKRRRK